MKGKVIQFFSRKFFPPSVFFVSSAAVFFLFSLSAAAQNRVVVRTESVVESDRVTLGAIADVSGRDAERLREVALGYAPQPGTLREIPKEKIRLAVAAAGFSAGDYTLSSSAPAARVRRASQIVEQAVLRGAVEKAVLAPIEAASSSGGGVEAKIVRLDLPERLEIPAGDFEVRANAGAVRNLFAPFAVSLEIRLGGAVIRRLSANVRVEAFAEVLTAGKDLTANSKIAAADVRLERRKLSKPLQNYLRSIENLRGMTAGKKIPAGEELTTDSLVAGLVVKAGDRVRIVGKSGRLRISVEGEARSAGKIGSRIMVKNLQSNANLQAVVVEEGLVEVNF